MEDFPVVSKQWKEFVIAGAISMGIHISQEQAEQISLYCNEMLFWNKKINLTAITKPLDVAVRHVLDSILPSRIIPPGASVLDIGSGGGIPGIILKIIKPEIKMTLIDASRKKITFLKHIIRSLGLNNIEALQIRTHNLFADIRYANSFEVVISRSFASLDKFVLNAVPFLSDNGMIVALKGNNVEEEVKMLDSISQKQRIRNRFNLEDYSMEIMPYTLPYSEIKRFIVVLKYKRRPGLIP
jgi:16S rRNA (guanine527-N7)-methyltransferase